MTDLFYQNPLATLQQLEKTPSRHDGIPDDLEEDLRNYGGELIQSAGILLELPQVVMATAQILFQRFFYVNSLKRFGILETGMGALLLAAKIEESIVRINDLIIIYDYLFRRARNEPTDPSLNPYSTRAQELKNMVIASESRILERLGFHVHVQLSYGILVNYLRILGLEDHDTVPRRAWNYLNDGLRTTVYVTHQPHIVAVSTIWLACRDEGVKLPVSPGAEWWLLFDARLDDIKVVGAHIRRLYYRKLDRARIPLCKEEIADWQRSHYR